MRNVRARRILVVMPTTTLLQRQQLEGLLEYAHANTVPPWQLHLDLSDLNDQSLHRLGEWECDGVVAFVTTVEERQKFAGTGLPTVILDATDKEPEADCGDNVVVIPYVRDLSAAEGRLAAEFFLSRGHTSFAYIGTAKRYAWDEVRRNAFVSRLAEAGLDCIVYPPLPPDEQDDFALESHRLMEWLKGLPRPTALCVVHDRRAQQVVSVAMNSGIRVPEDIAVIGSDNDTLLCEMTLPAISSIDEEPRSFGCHCGELLDALLHRRQPSMKDWRTHISVVERQSTGSVMFKDPLMRRVFNYITEHLNDTLTVCEIAKVCGCDKKTIQAHAHLTFGCTIGEEIRRRRLSRAAELLARTDRTTTDIANECGFCGASHLGKAFKRAFGQTPAAYRGKARRP